uniref:COP9 signalosome complex subunit 7 n=1 Tax=Noccaea caerulescens TaxID=107243 RepID=A0A1J3H8F8_NOCCA
MNIEQKQAEIIDLFVKRASVCKGEGDALGSILVEATSHPWLFAFSEILALSYVAELEGSTDSVYLDVLRLFAHGTWSDYKRNTRCAQLVPEQILKLKQLTVLTLAEINKVLPYDILMVELDITNVRELEDFLINDCMYVVQFAAGRDLRPGQLGNMMHTLENWLSASEDLLASIQDRIKWADNMSEVDSNRKQVKERVEEVKKSRSMKVPVDCG